MQVSWTSLGASHCPLRPARLHRTSRSKGKLRSSRSLASWPCCSRSSEGHSGVRAGPQSDKSAPTHPQEGTVKIWIEGRDASSLGPSYAYQTKLTEARSLPAPKSLLFLLAVQPASPGYRLSLCRGLSHSGFAPHLIPAPVVGPLDDVAGDVLSSKTER